MDFSCWSLGALAAREFEAAWWSVMTGHREDEEEHQRDVDEDGRLIAVRHFALLFSSGD